MAKYSYTIQRTREGVVRLKLKVGDKAKLLYAGFPNCPKGTIIKIYQIEGNDCIVFFYNCEEYVVSRSQLEPNKERVEFT
jgi:hypothetical protein